MNEGIKAIKMTSKNKGARMKAFKALTLSLVYLLILGATTVNAATQQNNYLKLKNMAKLYVQAVLEGSSYASKQQILRSMAEAGASEFKTHEYTPCPNRGKIKIDGKMVDGTNKHCLIMEYKYNGKTYETGTCKTPD